YVFGLQYPVRVDCPFQKGQEIFLAEGVQYIDLAAGQKGGDDFKTGVFRSGTNKGHPALFHGPQKGILLGFAESMDLIDKEDGVFGGEQPTTLFGLFYHLPYILDPTADGAQGVEGPLALLGDDLRQGGLSGTRGAPEEQRGDGPLFDLKGQCPT